MWALLQQPPPPVVVDVVRQPQPTQDISIDYIITMFETAGVFLLAAAVGGLIVGAIIIAVRKLRDASNPPSNETDHVRLRI